jgi:preprotein translocase subunit SecF
VGSVKKYQWSVEGGDVIYVRFTDGTVDKKVLEDTLAKTNLGDFTVTERGSGSNMEYKLTLEELQTVLARKLATQFDASKFDPKSSIERVETVGPRVGQQLRNTGLLSILLAILFILIYIAFRFDVRYAPGAVVALLHDVIITLGVYAAGQFEVSLPIIAALLTIVGYSLNDTIVVFDRIRENITGLPGRPISEIVNISVNDSLSRTVLTSFTTLLAVLALFGLGGGLVQNFSGAMIVGVIVGTYSSTFVASPVLIFMHEWLAKRQSNRPVDPSEGIEEVAEV